MAKGKNANPADAFRKAARKKELKKNKEQRSKARDFALVKKDTFELQDEIEKLEALPEPSGTDKQRLKELKAELEKINKKKEEYVAEHPEQRRLVYRGRKTDKDKDGDAGSSKPVDRTRKLFDKNGIPLHPERSIYYDPVLNPYGVPPPGMPYVERPLRPDEMQQSEEGAEGSDGDIVMPKGPPPGSLEQPIDSDDDIEMPEGPPPTDPFADIPIPPPPPMVPGMPPLPGSSVPLPVPSINSPLPPSGMPPPPPGFPSGFPPGVMVPPPSGVPALPAAPSGFSPPPPPPGGFPPFPHPPPSGFPPFPPPTPGGFASAPSGFMPPPPPGFFPRQTSAGAMQDPLTGVPHQTYQQRRVQPHPQAHPPPPPPNHPLPRNPAAPLSGAPSATATISAEPELRDLKKESTAFLPTSMRKKKAAPGASGAASGKVNAAPSVDGENFEAREEKPDLVSAMKGQFGDAPKPKGDYDKFLEDMGDILGKS